MKLKKLLAAMAAAVMAVSAAAVTATGATSEEAVTADISVYAQSDEFDTEPWRYTTSEIKSLTFENNKIVSSIHWDKIGTNVENGNTIDVTAADKIANNGLKITILGHEHQDKKISIKITKLIIGDEDRTPAETRETFLSRGLYDTEPMVNAEFPLGITKEDVGKSLDISFEIKFDPDAVPALKTVKMPFNEEKTYYIQAGSSSMNTPDLSLEDLGLKGVTFGELRDNYKFSFAPVYNGDSQDLGADAFRFSVCLRFGGGEHDWARLMGTNGMIEMKFGEESTFYIRDMWGGPFPDDAPLTAVYYEIHIADESKVSEDVAINPHTVTELSYEFKDEPINFYVYRKDNESSMNEAISHEYLDYHYQGEKNAVTYGDMKNARIVINNIKLSDLTERELTLSDIRLNIHIMFRQGGSNWISVLQNDPVPISELEDGTIAVNISDLSGTTPSLYDELYSIGYELRIDGSAGDGSINDMKPLEGSELGDTFIINTHAIDEINIDFPDDVFTMTVINEPYPEKYSNKQCAESGAIFCNDLPDYMVMKQLKDTEIKFNNVKLSKLTEKGLDESDVFIVPCIYTWYGWLEAPGIPVSNGDFVVKLSDFELKDLQESDWVSAVAYYLVIRGNSGDGSIETTKPMTGTENGDVFLINTGRSDKDTHLDVEFEDKPYVMTVKKQSETLDTAECTASVNVEGIECGVSTFADLKNKIISINNIDLSELDEYGLTPQDVYVRFYFNLKIPSRDVPRRFYCAGSIASLKKINWYITDTYFDNVFGPIDENSIILDIGYDLVINKDFDSLNDGDKFVINVKGPAKGDLNGNDIADTKDIEEMTGLLASSSYDSTNEKADVNEDGTFDIRDLSALVYILNV